MPAFHNGRPEEVLRELRNAFHREQIPSVPEMLDRYRFVHNNLNAILLRNGTTSPYDRSVFMELCRLSNLLAYTLHRTKPSV